MMTLLTLVIAFTPPETAAYPIPPQPLRWLFAEADLVVVGVAGKARSIEALGDTWETGAVDLTIRKVLKGVDSRPDPAVESHLDSILERLESADAPASRALVDDLVKLRRSNGDPVTRLLRARLQTAGPEAKARIRDQLDVVDRMAIARKKLSALDLLRMPEVKGRKFVSFNTGKWRAENRQGAADSKAGLGRCYVS